MKWILSLTINITITSFLYAQQPFIFNESLTWDQIKTASKLQHKMIFIDLYATWCMPCKKMDNEVYTNTSVSQYLRTNFIPVKIQADSSKNDTEIIKKKYSLAQELIKKFKVRSFPTYLFLDAEGNIQHRGMGYMEPDSFIAFCATANDPNKNHNGQLRQFKSNRMDAEELLNYAVMLSGYREDSLSKAVARVFKEKVIDNKPVAQVIAPKFLPFFDRFSYLLTSKDSISRYIYVHQQDVNTLMQDSGFAARTISQIATGEFLIPNIKKAESEKQTPNWENIRTRISKTWDKSLASDLVLKSQITWYSAHQDWANAIKYHMERLDKLNNNFGFWQAAEANNFIYLTVLKYSNDSNILRKAKNYMQTILVSFPDDHEKMDTYANLLYKLGKKEEAIRVEKEALSIAEKKKDEECKTLFKETISKMEANILTWDQE